MEIMKTLISFLSLLFFFCNANFAQVDFEWAKQISGTSAEEAKTSTTDANGNTIVAGLYTSAVLTVGSTDLVNANDNETFFDIFLIKYDKDGNVLWAKTAGGAGHEIVNDVATDAEGNVFLVGGYDSTATFDDQVLDNESEMFLAKYNSDGELLWIVDSESNNGMAFVAPNSMVVDANGDVLLGGPGLGSLDATIFGYPYIGDAEQDGYLMKVGSEGSVQWLNIFDAVDPGNVSSDEHMTITELGINPASNQISVSGTFAGILDFGGTTLTNMNYGAGPGILNKDIFVATYETDGDLLWAQNIGGLSEIGSSVGDPKGIDTDASNNVYLTGVLTGLMIFSNGDTLQTEGFNLPTFEIGYPELFIVKYNSTGVIQWIKKAYSSNDTNKEVMPEGIVVDEQGNSFITGFYEWDATFGSIQMPLINEGTFISKVNTNGDFEWVASGNSFGFDTGVDVGIDHEGNAYAVGHHQFTPTFGDFTLGDGGLQGTFVVKVGTGTSSTSSIYNNIDLVLSPNPVSNTLNIKYETALTETAKISIVNALGEKVFESSISNIISSIDVSKLSGGTYFLNCQYGEKHTIEKFIKQ